jgi:hypothetical protein
MLLQEWGIDSAHTYVSASSVFKALRSIIIKKKKLVRAMKTFPQLGADFIESVVVKIPVSSLRFVELALLQAPHDW